MRIAGDRFWAITALIHIGCSLDVGVSGTGHRFAKESSFVISAEGVLLDATGAPVLLSPAEPSS